MPRKRRILLRALVPQLLELQNHQCAICHGDITLSTVHIDHDHKTGYVRGALCGHCNKGLGFFRDSLDNLANAKKYLLQPPADRLKLR